MLHVESGLQVYIT